MTLKNFIWRYLIIGPKLEDKMIKDSGKRIKMAGMVRDTNEDKIRYDLILDGPMFRRWAEHLTAGAKKYEARNWMSAKSLEELNRFKESALRHFIQWFNGEDDEDHAAAVFFNVNGAEYVRAKIDDELLHLQIEPWSDRRRANRRGPHNSERCLVCLSLLDEVWDRRRGEGRRKDD